MTVRIEEMTWVEYADRISKGGVVAFVPVGSLEQHGPHLPMHCDEVIPRALSESVAKQIDGIVTPSISFGTSRNRDPAAGTIFPARSASMRRS